MLFDFQLKSLNKLGNLSEYYWSKLKDEIIVLSKLFRNIYCKDTVCIIQYDTM